MEETNSQNLEVIAQKIEEEAQSLFEEQKPETTKEESKEEVKAKKPKPRWEDFKKSEVALIFGNGLNGLIAKVLNMEVKEVAETEIGQAVIYTINWYLIDYLPEPEIIDPNSPLVVLGNSVFKLGSKVMVKKVMQG